VAPDCLRQWSSISKTAPGAPHPMRVQENAALTQHISKNTSQGVCNGDVTLAPGQTRGEDTPMLKCSGCRVAKFCSADHQKTARKKATFGRESVDGAAQEYLRSAHQVA
jgi:hypothetical protein